MFPFCLALYILSILSFALFVFMSFKQYSVLNKEKYNMRNHFPYELRNSERFMDNPIGNISLIFSVLILNGFYSLYITNNLGGLNIAIVISGILSSISILLIYFISLDILKGHIASFSALIVFCLMGYAINAYKGINEYINLNNPVSLILGIISSIFALFILVLFVNPKLSFNLKMDSVDKDGTIVYVRPKKFILSITEWIIISLIYILPFISLISLIK